MITKWKLVLKLALYRKMLDKLDRMSNEQFARAVKLTLTTTALSMNFGVIYNLWRAPLLLRDLLEHFQGVVTTRIGSPQFWLNVFLVGINLFSAFLVAATVKMWLQFNAERLNQVRVNASPPRHAEYLLWLLMPREQREGALTRLIEDFEAVRERYGLRKARRWCWWEVLRSATPLVDGLIERVIKWGVLGTMAEWFRRHI